MMQARQTFLANLSPGEIATLILRGDARTTGQVLTWIENGEARAKEILKLIYAKTGRAHIVGITGGMGSGKSTLIDRMTAELRKARKQVGVLSVDPSSRFSGGALLGDRLRMRSHFLDRGVFIRSLATRGSTGGLSHCIFEAVHLLDAMGNDVILIETIGAGQDQIEIAGAAHTVVVVVMPESGDEIQAIKAGLFEIADLLVINKTDLGGAEAMMFRLKDLVGDSGVRVLKTSASKNEGIKDLIDAIEERHAQVLANGDHRQRLQRLCRRQLLALIRDNLFARIKEKVDASSIDRLARQISERELDPYTAAEILVKELGFSGS